MSIDTLDIDFTGIDAATGGAGMAPPGRHRVRIIEAKPVNSKTPGMNFTFEVVAGDHAGKTMQGTVWLSPAALPYAKQRFELIGLKLDGSVKLSPAMFVGKVLDVLAVNEPFEGKTGDMVDSTKVDRWLDPSAAGPVADSRSDMPAGPAAAAAPADDELPF